MVLTVFLSLYVNTSFTFTFFFSFFSCIDWSETIGYVNKVESKLHFMQVIRWMKLGISQMLSKRGEKGEKGRDTPPPLFPSFTLTFHVRLRRFYLRASCNYVLISFLASCNKRPFAEEASVGRNLILDEFKCTRFVCCELIYIYIPYKNSKK